SSQDPDATRYAGAAAGPRHAKTPAKPKSPKKSRGRILVVAALALSLIAVAAVVFLALFERQELRTDARETASSAA
ncbi:serine/threonine protein kinase, partial [Mycobacterium sp. ITM-2017-0098]